MNVKHDNKPWRDALRYIMETRELLQRDICQIFGVSQATVSYWINGIRGFDRKNRHKNKKLIYVMLLAIMAEERNQDERGLQCLRSLREEITRTGQRWASEIGDSESDSVE